MKSVGVRPKFFTQFSSTGHGPTIGTLRNMFREDIYNSLVPIRNEEQANLRVKFSGHDDDVESATNLLRSISKKNRVSTNELVCDVLETIAQHIAWNGVYVSEIIRGNSGELRLHSFTPDAAA